MKTAYPFLAVLLRTFFYATLLLPEMVLAASDALPTAPAGSIKLPKPVLDGKVSLEKALNERRSVRRYQELPLSLADLSQLLWAAQGVTSAGGKRTAPSAGALYPLEVTVVAGKVTGLPAGIYAYDHGRHELRTVAEGDARAELSRAARDQSPARDAPAVLVISAVYERTTVKYGERGIRYVHMEAGHAAQNVYLQAAARNLGTVVIGAFDDDWVRRTLRMKGQEHPLYLMPVGNR